MSNEIRKPQQKRSIETKNKIINASFELFSEVGYFSTNTAEIAKRAGVSTGIVYGYFKDKRDILLEVLGLYADRAYQPVFDMLSSVEQPLDFDELIPKIIDEAIVIHTQNAHIHEALHSLTHVDNAVNARFIEMEDDITLKFAEHLASLGYKTSDLNEKIHLAMNMIQSFAHECVYDKHSYIEYDNMRKIVSGIIIKLFSA